MHNQRHYGMSAESTSCVQPDGGAEERGRWLYVIGGRRPPYKVGLATNPARRLSEIQVGNPNRMEIRALFYNSSQRDTRDVERAVHLALRKHRRRGEWFGAELDEIISAIKDALGQGSKPILECHPLFNARLGWVWNGKELRRRLVVQS